MFGNNNFKNFVKVYNFIERQNINQHRFRELDIYAQSLECVVPQEKSSLLKLIGN